MGKFWSLGDSNFEGYSNNRFLLARASPGIPSIVAKSTSAGDAGWNSDSTSVVQRLPQRCRFFAAMNERPFSVSARAVRFKASCLSR